VVLQRCYSGVTVVYSGVTVALQRRYSGVTVVVHVVCCANAFGCCNRKRSCSALSKTSSSVTAVTVVLQW
jgi:hypothetical protein